MLHVDPAHIADHATDHPVDDARARIDGQQAMLTRLAQIGMEIAEACGRQAEQSPVEAAAAFAKVARAVRMTIALQSRLAKDLADLDRADDAAQKARASRRRMRLRRLVHYAAQAAVDAGIDAGRRYSGQDAIEDEIERLSAEAYERLTDAEEGDLMGRPFEAVVAGICADLGLPPDWSARLLANVRPPPILDMTSATPSEPMSAARGAAPEAAPPPTARQPAALGALGQPP